MNIRESGAGEGNMQVELQSKGPELTRQCMVHFRNQREAGKAVTERGRERERSGLN